MTTQGDFQRQGTGGPRTYVVIRARCSSELSDPQFSLIPERWAGVVESGPRRRNGVA
jgi:hypothetical protein